MISDKALAELMKQGQPREKFFLRWFGRESFFDDGVQKVLSPFHPAMLEYPKPELKAFPIEAWSVVNSVARLTTPQNWNQLLPFMQHCPDFITELLSAVMKFRIAEAKLLDNPDRTIDWIKTWRARRFFAETKAMLGEHFQWTHPEVVKHNTLLKRRLATPGLRRRGAPPIPVKDTPKPPTKWLDGERKLPGRTITTAALRQAVKKENDRRDQIMKYWAESWIACPSLSERYRKAD